MKAVQRAWQRLSNAMRLYGEAVMRFPIFLLHDFFTRLASPNVKNAPGLRALWDNELRFAEILPKRKPSATQTCRSTST